MISLKALIIGVVTVLMATVITYASTAYTKNKFGELNVEVQVNKTRIGLIYDGIKDIKEILKDKECF